MFGFGKRVVTTAVQYYSDECLFSRTVVLSEPVTPEMRDWMVGWGEVKGVNTLVFDSPRGVGAFVAAFGIDVPAPVEDWAPDAGKMSMWQSRWLR